MAALALGLLVALAVYFFLIPRLQKRLRSDQMNQTDDGGNAEIITTLSGRFSRINVINQNLR